MKGRFRGGGGWTVSASGLPALTGVMSGIMASSRFLPAPFIRKTASFHAAKEKSSIGSAGKCLGPHSRPIARLGEPFDPGQESGSAALRSASSERIDTANLWATSYPQSRPKRGGSMRTLQRFK